MFQLEHLAYLLPLRQDDNAERCTFVHHHLEHLRERLAIVPQKWWLFLYGRNGTGGCAVWFQDIGDARSGRNAVSRDVFDQWPSGEDKLLGRYLELLITLGFNIFSMPLSLERRRELKSRDRVPRRYYCCD